VGAYLSAARIGAGRALTARAELATRISFYVVILVVLFPLWRAATAAGGGAVAGYDFVAIAWYLTFAEAAVIATEPRMIERIGEDIGDGAVAVEMLRPASVVGLRIAVECGRALVRLGAALIAGAVFVVIAGGAPASVGAAALAVPSAVLAVACHVVAQHAFGAAAFWLDEARATWFLFQKLVFIAGGMLLPLEIFPSWLQTLARALPFWTMAYAPGRLAAGHFEAGLLGGQIAWLAVLALCARLAFTGGERRLQVGGG
jgi:ABC-2 type transport system permease protein